MRIILILSLLLIVVNCSSGKQVYWCGDHPCANKKEREAYFKKTMTVEIKEMGKKKKSDKPNAVMTYFYVTAKPNILFCISCFNVV